MNRLSDIVHFYTILDRLEKHQCGKKTLASCNGRMNWPRRGVYFFFENGEFRTDTGTGDRVVRVGTHAVRTGSRTTLWRRLAQHRGTLSGGGHHRGSIFRSLIGDSAARQHSPYSPLTWGQDKTASAAIRKLEADHEQLVSRIIGAMQFIVLEIDDEPASTSLRALIERNSINLLSNYGRKKIDPPSPDWLGHHSSRERVCGSGLWNQDYVNKDYDPRFLDTLERLVHNACHANVTPSAVA